MFLAPLAVTVISAIWAIAAHESSDYATALFAVTIGLAWSHVTVGMFFADGAE